MAAKKKPAAKKAAENKKDEPEQSQSIEDETSKSAETSEASEASSEKEDRDPGPYTPRHRPLQNADFDQVAAEKKRQAELAEERRVGLLRTAGKPVN
jgi:hypothetical protein